MATAVPVIPEYALREYRIVIERAWARSVQLTSTLRDAAAQAESELSPGTGRLPTIVSLLEEISDKVERGMRTLWPTGELPTRGDLESDSDGESDFEGAEELTRRTRTRRSPTEAREAEDMALARLTGDPGLPERLREAEEAEQAEAEEQYWTSARAARLMEERMAEAAGLGARATGGAAAQRATQPRGASAAGCSPGTTLQRTASSKY